MLAITALLGAGVSGALYTLPRMSSGSAPRAPEKVQAATPAPPSSFTLSKAIEVTGFRIGADKPEVHYLVVNHTTAGLGDMTVYVTLWASGTKPGQPPLCRFSFRTGGLGPLAAKEMTTSLDKLSRPGGVPDWQDLRAQIEVGQ